MKSRPVAHLLALVLGCWLLALQGWIGESLGRAWLPDLGLVFALALAARVDTRPAILVAVLLALARAAHSLDAPQAIVAGHLGAVLVLVLARGAIEVRDPLIAVPLCFGVELVLHLWYGAVRSRENAALGPEALALVDASGSAWRPLCAALASGAAAPFAWTLVPRVPGLSPLWRARL